MNEELLTLYYYDELDAAERQRVEHALNSDLTLARQYRELEADLDALSDAAAIVPPTHVVHRWHDAIDQAAAKEAATTTSGGFRFHVAALFWGSAIAAALALGIAIGINLDAPDAIDVQLEDSSALTRGLLVHFEQSRNQLSGLHQNNPGERTELIMQIVQQNRLFARVAKQNDSQDLARVLRAFEPILVQLAAADISNDEAARLQSQLAFELNIVLTKLSRQVSEETGLLET